MSTHALLDAPTVRRYWLPDEFEPTAVLPRVIQWPTIDQDLAAAEARRVLRRPSIPDARLLRRLLAGLRSL